MVVVMNTKHSYIAVFTPDPSGAYNVFFPELPGCFTYGETLEHAKEMAKEVLELWLEEMEAQGEYPKETVGQPYIERIQVTLPSIHK